MPHSHPDGFSFDVPTDAEVTDQGGASTVRPEGWRRQRSPYRLVVQGGAPAPGPELGEEAELDGRQVRFRRQVLPGGSGGAQHVVEAHVRSPGGAEYRLELSEQTEGDRAPHEAVLWTAAASLSP